MLTRQDHLAQAAHNEALADSLVGSAFTDWAVIALFYAALHLVDAHSHPVRYSSHAARLRYVRTTPTLFPIYFHYQELKTRSEAARYEAVHFSDSFVRSLRLNTYDPLKEQLTT